MALTRALKSGALTPPSHPLTFLQKGDGDKYPLETRLNLIHVIDKQEYQLTPTACKNDEKWAAWQLMSNGNSTPILLEYLHHKINIKLKHG